LFTTVKSNIIRSLDNGLIMKFVNTPEDIERLAVFNARVHNDEHVARMTRAMIQHHPHTHPEEWPFIEDESTGEIVSALCLIPWTWRYADVTLKAGEMGIVGTLESYRRRGLIRALDDYFNELLRAGKYDLSHIQGIPYYYRQFGYEYAVPLEGGWQIRRDQIPDDLPEAAQGFHFRPAALDDLPVLARRYDEAAHELGISAVRDLDSWRYLIEHQPHTQNLATTWLVLDTGGAPVGYFRVTKVGFGAGSIVEESSRLSHPAALAALSKIKALSDEWEKPYIRLSAPDTSPLVRVARAWGAHSQGRYAWQIHLPDAARLLCQIVPVLERRIAASPFAGMTETVLINLYREAVELHIKNGNITAVTAAGFRNWEGLSINIPPLLFAPLVLGYRSREELTQTYPDMGVWGQSQYLIDVLFPKMTAFIHNIY
jgi:predicted N-acetyltransferase YhbS